MDDLTSLKAFLTLVVEPVIEPVVSRAVRACLTANQQQPPNQTSHSKDSEPISTEELCKRLDITKPTAWAWENKGIIKGYHLGNKKYYIWGEVMATLTKKKEGTL